MDKKLYERSDFRDDESYEEYLNKIRKGKNYKYYKELADNLLLVGVPFYKIRGIVNLVHSQIDSRNGYHYKWYSLDAERAIELVLIDFLKMRGV